MRILKNGIVSITINLIALLISVLTTILLGKTLGSSGYGIYSFAYSVIMILTIPIQSGIPTLVMRETAKLDARKNYKLIRSLWAWSEKFVFSGAMLAIIVNFLILFTAKEEYKTTLAVSALLIPFLALGQIRSAALRGLHYVILGQIPEIIIRPLILAIGIITLWSINFPISPALAMGIHAAGCVIAFSIGAFLLRNKANQVFDLNLSPKPGIDELQEITSWKKSIIPLSGVNSLQVLNANIGILILAVISNSTDAGLLKIAITFSSVLMFGRTAVISIVQPKMSVAYQNGRLNDLQKFAGAVSLFSFSLTIIIFIIILAFGELSLIAIFGPEFAAAWPVVIVLMVGQVVNSFFASTGSCLMMANQEKAVLKTIALVTLLIVPIYLILSSKFGAVGTAWATTLYISLLHYMYWKMCRSRIEIDASPISYFLRARKRSN